MSLDQVFAPILKFLLSPTLYVIIKSLMIGFGLASLVWLIYTVSLFRKLNTPAPKLDPENLPPIKDKAWFLNEWQRIDDLAKGQRAADHRAALNAALDLLDQLLVSFGFQSGSLEAKISRLDETILPDIASVKDALKLQKEIQNNPNQPLIHDELVRSLGVVRETFRRFGLFE